MTVLVFKPTRPHLQCGRILLGRISTSYSYLKVGSIPTLPFANWKYYRRIYNPDNLDLSFEYRVKDQELLKRQKSIYGEVLETFME